MALAELKLFLPIYSKRRPLIIELKKSLRKPTWSRLPFSHNCTHSIEILNLVPSCSVSNTGMSAAFWSE